MLDKHAASAAPQPASCSEQPQALKRKPIAVLLVVHVLAARCREPDRLLCIPTPLPALAAARIGHETVQLVVLVQLAGPVVVDLRAAGVGMGWVWRCRGSGAGA